MPLSQFDYQILEMIENARSFSKLSPLNLGGPPGGYIGLLPQDKVQYDIAESGTLAGSGSLVDNLNHIRYRLTVLESGGSPGSISIYEDDILVASGVTVLNFEGNVSTLDEGGGYVTVTVSGVTASGGGSPAGANGYIQYYEDGNFAADASLLWDNAQKGILITGENSSAGLLQQVYSNNTSHAPYVVGLRYRGTELSPTAIVDNDPIFRIRGRGYDGSSLSSTQVEHRFVVVGNWNGSNHGTKQEFYVTPSGSTIMELAAELIPSGSGLDPSFNLASGYTYNINGSPHTHSYTSLTNNSGWQSVLETWTYSSVDDPVYQIYVSGDITSDPDYKLGNKVWCQNNSTDFFGFIVKIGSYDGGNDRTPVDLYGGQNYDIANSAITAPYISKVHSPDGFSLDRDDWDWFITDTTQRTQSSPSAGTWYNLGSVSINGPIGKWEFEVTLDAAGLLSGGGQISVFVTLSTGSSSESNPEFTRKINSASALSQFESSFHLTGLLSLTTKTTYYVNTKSNQAITTLYNQNSQQTLVIRLKSQYL